MSHFRAKIVIVILGVFFLSGYSVLHESLINPPIGVVDKSLKNGSNEATEIVLNDVSLIFVGDLMFDRSIRQFAEKKGNDFIFEKIGDFLKTSDLVVANLEGSITDNASKSVNTVPDQKGHLSFTFDKSLAETLAKNNIKLVNLGNNHILNLGTDGLNQTKNYLKENNIEYFGDPLNKEKNYTIKEINGIKIGFVSYNQFGGSAEETINNIKNIRNESDIIIVYTHWGKEYEKTSSSSIKNLAHSFVDSGANLIIGTHPHVVQDTEEYKRKRIYYSLGNFIFDQYFSAETMNGLAVKVLINAKDKSIKFQETSLLIYKNGQVLPK